MQLIQTVTLAGSAANLQVLNIPSTYTDLVLVMSCRSDSTGIDVTRIRASFNGDTANNYRSRWIEGRPGSGAYSYAEGPSNAVIFGLVPTANATTSTFSNTVITIPNYTDTTAKAFSCDSVAESNSTSISYGAHNLVAGYWSGTGAITNITTSLEHGNFVAGSTLSLYGITKGSGGATVS